MQQQTAKRLPGRPRKPEGEAKRAFYQTRIREPLRERLSAYAAKNGRSLSEEIEHRLERSFRDDDIISAIIDRWQPRKSGATSDGAVPSSSAASDARGHPKP